MSMTEIGLATNSQPWWDAYFHHAWEKHDGSAQTEYFMRCVVEHLAAPETYYLRESGAAILDWGCAFGQGVNCLATAYPRCRVSGMDFSSRAISSASKRYPQYEFLFSEKGHIERPFDVIVTSNCLEHFENSLEIARQHLARCRDLYVVLVPYAESPLHETHVTTFTERSFPEEMAGFERIAATVIDTDPKFWRGRQLLVTYASPAYLQRRPPLVRREEERSKWNALYEKLPMEAAPDAVMEFGDELNQQVADLLPNGGRILEAGCGAGWQSLSLARSGKYQLSLMDFSPEALRYASEIFQREDIPADFICQDAFLHGEPKYDLVFNAGVLEHYELEEQAELLRAMASWSRNYVLVLVPNRLCYWYWIWRLQASAVGDWPFGKEVPLADLSQVFEMAGLKFVGQCSCATKWPERFLDYLPGLDGALRERILAVHRSGIIPPAQSGYLLAGLGCKQEGTLVGGPWKAAPMGENRALDRMAASLTDALAMSLAAEHREMRMREVLSAKEAALCESCRDLRATQSEVEVLKSRLPELQAAAEQLESQIATLQAAGQTLTVRLHDAERQLQVSRDQVAEKDGSLAGLEGQVAVLQTAAEALTIRLHDAERQLRASHDQVAERDRSLADLETRVAALQAETEALTVRLHDIEFQLQASRNQVAEKDLSLAGLAAQVAALQGPAANWNRLQRSRGWAGLQFLWKIRLLLAPWGSRRERAARFAWRLVRYPRQAPGAVRRGAIQSLRGLRRVLAPAGTKRDRLVRPVIERLRRLAKRGAHGGGQPTPGPQGQLALLSGSAKYDVICLPVIPWESRFQRPQQLMQQFAEHGHHVFYASLGFHNGPEATLVEVRPGVFEMTLPGTPGTIVYQQMATAADIQRMAAAIDQFRIARGIASAAVVVQLPFWADLARELRARFGWPIIYDCMDDHSGFSTNSSEMLRAEEKLTRDADLVVVTADLLCQKMAGAARRIVTVRNACDYAHFAQVQPHVRGQSPVTVGFYGAIAEWFDGDLAADLAEIRPDWNFELIGSTFTGQVARLEGLPNVKFLGEQPYVDLPRLVQHWDCFIIPFKRIPLTEATNPVKAYEMLATGKPIVAVDLPELRPLAREGLLNLADTGREFARLIERAIRDDKPRRQEQRREFAAQNTWQHRIRALDQAVRDVSPLASIIIVTYNNLALNQDCLRSIFELTDYPNFEVIVVDNASSDGTPAWLEEYARHESRLRVTLNRDNRGYAIANNQALREARGEFLCLLNNDTVVTHGWLSKLIRHLRANPGWGMVGPTTNLCGNEGRVPVDYSSLEAMPDWAAKFCRAHDGETFPIRTLGFFCVAFSRALLQEVGLLDEQFKLGYFEDTDYCCRIVKQGYQLRCARDCFVHHWHNASFKLLDPSTYTDAFRKNQAIFEAKWNMKMADLYAT